MTASVAGGTVTLTDKDAGTGGNNFALLVNSTTTQSGFTGTSFPASPSGATLAGGLDPSQSTAYSVSLGLAPNGDVLTANDNVNGNWTYVYDDINRLATASKPGQAFEYKYDRYGNRWQQNLTAGSGPAPQFSFTQGNNRIDGYSYDAAGNLLNDGSNSYTYDAENRLISVGGSVSYVYDGDGRRVRKTVNGTSVDFLYDLGINVVAEMSSTGSWNRGEVYAGGRHLATYNQGTTFFNHGDWLGTERVRTGINGPVSETCSSLPFGDGQSCSGTESSPNHFTGKERDAETGLDYFGARYYGSNMGRFLSPDEFPGGPIEASRGVRGEPGPLLYADITNPQSLNKYQYAFNNPLRYVDPDGHFTAPVHTWLTDEAARRLAYSEKTQGLLVSANLEVDRVSNQLNNKEHGMSDAFTTNEKAREAIQKTIDGRLDNAVKEAASGNLKSAVGELGAGLHTVQDYEAHGGVTLLGHGGEAKNDNSPEKVRDALADSEKFLQRFEQQLTTKVGEQRAQQLLTNLKRVGDE